MDPSRNSTPNNHVAPPDGDGDNSEGDGLHPRQNEPHVPAVAVEAEQSASTSGDATLAAAAAVPRPRVAAAAVGLAESINVNVVVAPAANVDVSRKRENDEVAVADGDEMNKNNEEVTRQSKKIKLLDESDFTLGEPKMEVGQSKITSVHEGSIGITEQLEKSHSAKAKKERKEFTAAEKLNILLMIEDPMAQPVSQKQLREKYNVSKSSLHRWKQQQSRLQELVANEGKGGRKRDTKDYLVKIKDGLKKFADENSAKDVKERLAITTRVVQAQAIKLREELLQQYNENNSMGGALLEQGNDSMVLGEEEYKALQSFTVTKSWASRIASTMDLLSSPRPRRPKKKGNDTAKGSDDIVIEKIREAAGRTNTEEGTDCTPNAVLEQAKQNTQAYLNSIQPADNATPKPKKERREFSAIEKLHIIQEMERDKLKMEQVCAKYFTTKSSVFRWKIQHREGKLEAMMSDAGKQRRKRIVNDKLAKIKDELEKFIEENRALPACQRMPINGTVIQAQAQLAREKLLDQHEKDPSKGLLEPDEESALIYFKASKGWARKTALKHGWKMVGSNVGGVTESGEVAEISKGMVNGEVLVEGDQREEGKSNAIWHLGGSGEEDISQDVTQEPSADAFDPYAVNLGV